MLPRFRCTLPEASLDVREAAEPGSNLAIRPNNVDAWLPPSIDASGLCLLNTLKLALAAQIRLELGKHTEHIKECLSGGAPGVDRLFRWRRACALGYSWADAEAAIGLPPGWTDVGDFPAAERLRVLRREIEPLNMAAIERIADGDIRADGERLHFSTSGGTW